MTTPPRARAFVGVLAAAAAGLLAASCVLLVSPAAYGEHCKFDGDDTACGRCLRDRCQPAIDGCCKDDSCAATLATLESCALRSDAACNDLATRRGSAGKNGELATCATTACAAVCRSFTGATDTKCSEPTFGRGATCSCSSAPGTGNAFECSPETYAGTVCCAPDGWPATGLACTCLPFGCDPLTPGCSCDLKDTAVLPPATSECRANSCCVSTVDPDQCVCGRVCFDNETRVGSCSLAERAADGGPAIGCKKGLHRVDRCTIGGGADAGGP